MERQIRLKVAVCAMTVTLLLLCLSAGAAVLTTEQMDLNPFAAPYDKDYTYPWHAVGYVATFSGVNSLQVLPLLKDPPECGSPGPFYSNYYYTPTVDYTGDITGTDGSITFMAPGPYWVKATYTDNSVGWFDYAIDCLLRAVPRQGSYARNSSFPPVNQIIDENISAGINHPDPNATGIPVHLEPNDWNHVIDWIKSAFAPDAGISLGLGGHGEPGEFIWPGTPSTNNQATHLSSDNLDRLSELKGYVREIYFMSCDTAYGEKGQKFLEDVGKEIGGKAYGYTDRVGVTTDGKIFFQFGCGHLIPEPATLSLLALGGLALMRRVRR